MDNHPIPQDITGFQFKLIGKMTIRQFIYVAVGGVIAWAVFFILKPPAFIKFPVAVISLGLGALIAFVPIDGRPMDTMIRNFIKALLSPTQFIYQKGGNQNPEEKIQVTTNVPLLSSQPVPTIPEPVASPATVSQIVQSPPPPAKPEEVQTQKETEAAPQAPAPVVFPDPTAMPSSFVKGLNEQQNIKKPEAQNQITNERQELKRQIEELQKKLEEKEKLEKSQPQINPSAPTPASTPQVQAATPQDQKELGNMLAESVRQKEALEKQIIEMQTKQAGENKQKFTPITATQQQTTHNVRKIPADMASSIGIPDAPEAPNLITGIIKDSRGNPIPNILVEVKDPDSNPARAFKTNKLGKFASATPLSNGKYVISFEDPAEKHKFDDIEMELVGAIVMPLEVISVDPREELRRELFN